MTLKVFSLKSYLRQKELCVFPKWLLRGTLKQGQSLSYWLLQPLMQKEKYFKFPWISNWEIAKVPPLPYMVDQAEVKVAIVLKHWHRSRSQKKNFFSERLLKTKAGTPPSLQRPFAKKRYFCIHQHSLHQGQWVSMVSES